jgi:hypothetical protein
VLSGDGRPLLGRITSESVPNDVAREIGSSPPSAGRAHAAVGEARRTRNPPLRSHPHRYRAMRYSRSPPRGILALLELAAE